MYSKRTGSCVLRNRAETRHELISTEKEFDIRSYLSAYVGHKTRVKSETAMKATLRSAISA